MIDLLRRRMLLGKVALPADIVLELGGNNITSFCVFTKDESQYRIIYTGADGVMHSKMGENGVDYHFSTQPYSTILFYHKQPRYIRVGSIKIPFYNNVIRVILNNYDAITNVYGRSNTVLTKIVNYENINSTSIENNAFYGCPNLALTELPKTLTIIGDSAFRNCTNIALTELPKNLTSIGSNAFYGCPKITDIKILNTTQMITSADSMFPTGTTIRVPNTLLPQYQADANWSTYNLIGY